MAGVLLVSTQIGIHQSRRTRRTDVDGPGAPPNAVEQFRVARGHDPARLRPLDPATA